MREKRNILIIILFIIFLILNIWIYINKNENVIYIGNYTKIIKNKDKVTIKEENKKINLTKAKIYFNNDFIDGYIKSEKTKMNNGDIAYNAYSESGSILRFSDDLFAYTGNINVKIADANILTNLLDNDFGLIYEFLESDYGINFSIDYANDFIENKKIIFDIDNDGDDEYIYSLNIISEGSEDLSYVFLVDDGEFKLISSEHGITDDPNTKKVSFFNLLDIDDDNKYEIVLKLKTGEYGNNLYKLYGYDDNEIKEY